MKYRHVLVLCVLGGCSAPAPSVPTIASEAPEHVDRSNTACSAIEAETVCKSAGPPEVKRVNADWIVPGGPGFWCADFRSARDDSAHGVCYRIQETCETARKFAIKSGGDVTACRPRESAYCFTMANVAEQANFWRCYNAERHCARGHEILEATHTKLMFSECSLTARSRLDDRAGKRVADRSR